MSCKKRGERKREKGDYEEGEKKVDCYYAVSMFSPKKERGGKDRNHERSCSLAGVEAKMRNQGNKGKIPSLFKKNVSNTTERGTGETFLKRRKEKGRLYKKRK